MTDPSPKINLSFYRPRLWLPSEFGIGFVLLRKLANQEVMFCGVEG
jgi:hypothetical protein